MIHFAALATARRRDRQPAAGAARSILGGSPDAAVETLLTRMQSDRAFATRAGREDLLQAFALFPPDDARVSGWRRRLAAVLNESVCCGQFSLSCRSWSGVGGIAMVRTARRDGKGVRAIGAALMLLGWGNLHDPRNDTVAEAKDGRIRKGTDSGHPLD